jgi:hypothetical protein
MARRLETGNALDSPTARDHFLRMDSFSRDSDRKVLKDGSEKAAVEVCLG